MVTLDENRTANYFLLELLSEQTRFRESASILLAKHGSKLERPWESFSGESQEDPGLYDDWMEYRSLQQSLKDVEQRIAEIRKVRDEHAK
jgi:hypothetical protein